MIRAEIMVGVYAGYTADIVMLTAGLARSVDLR